MRGDGVGGDPMEGGGGGGVDGEDEGGVEGGGTMGALLGFVGLKSSIKFGNLLLPATKFFLGKSFAN